MKKYTEVFYLKEKMLIMTLLIVFLFLPLSNPLVINVGENDNISEITKNIFFSTTSTLTMSTNITIRDNSEFSNWTSTGDGSSGDPYFIENYVISCTSNNYGVSIQDTNKYFILQNISVSSCSTGFYFSNVTHGSIINSTATSNNNIGFKLTSASNYNTLINNTASNNFYYGFELCSSNYNTLFNNIGNSASNSYESAFYLIS